MINRGNACSKSDTKKKDNKPDSKKKDNKPDTTKKDNKSAITKKDNKPDTTKNNIENRVSNRIKYEIQDIEKYRKVLIKMIDERIDMLDLINYHLVESVADTDICENMRKFDRLCDASRIRIKSCYRAFLSRIYAINVGLECLCDGVGNGIWPKDITYNLIGSIDESSVALHYTIIIREKKNRLIKIAHKGKED